jgi:undecaprenyl-diphosphatase
MELVAAVVLGIVQGLTEFLPVSSSAHLILVPWVLGWKPEGLTFDVALHLGTSAALLVYFRKEWVNLAREALSGIFAGDPFGNTQRRLAWYLVLGTIPAAVAGLALGKRIEDSARSPLIIVGTLVVFGLLLYYSERRGRQRRTIDDLTLADALWIGTSQALALVPGVSRSGITMSTAMLRDADRTTAARFSFLLSTPVILGAGVKEGLHLVHGSAEAGGVAWSVLLAGTAAAALTGLLCIRFLLRYLQSNTFTPFVVYRIVLAVVVLALFLHGA